MTEKAKRVRVGSGITEHEQIQTTPNSDEDWRELREAVAQQFDWESYTAGDIAALETAMEQFRSQGCPGDGHPQCCGRRHAPRDSGLYVNPAGCRGALLRAYSDREWFWSQMLMEHRIATDHLNEGKASGAMCAAARYGSLRALYDMKFRHEKDALRGRKTFGGAARGGESRAANLDRSKQQAARDAYMAALPQGRESTSQERSAARRAAQKASGLGERQVRRILTDPK